MNRTAVKLPRLRHYLDLRRMRREGQVVFAEKWAEVAAENLGYSGPKDFESHIRWLNTYATETGNEDGVTDEVNLVRNVVEAEMKKVKASINREMVARELLVVAKELTAVVLETKYSVQYKNMIARLRTLPWDDRPMKNVSSAITSLSGTISGHQVSFSWHSPSTVWGPTWNFLGLMVSPAPRLGGSEDMFDETAKKIMEKHGPGLYGDRPIDWIRWVREGEPGLDEHLQQQNLREFGQAISFAMSLPEGA